MDEMKAVDQVHAEAEKAVDQVHAEAESWLSKHKWPVMLALFCAVVVVVGLLVA